MGFLWILVFLMCGIDLLFFIFPFFFLHALAFVPFFFPFVSSHVLLGHTGKTIARAGPQRRSKGKRAGPADVWSGCVGVGVVRHAYSVIPRAYRSIFSAP